MIKRNYKSNSFLPEHIKNQRNKKQSLNLSFNYGDFMYNYGRPTYILVAIIVFYFINFPLKVNYVHTFEGFYLLFKAIFSLLVLLYLHNKWF